MIVIVDYGVGNVRSIANMLKKAGAQPAISSDPDRIANAEKLILPGVGAFDTAMSNLEARSLVAPLNFAVRERKAPVIGLCLGMQLMTRSSEEGRRPGLGWLDATTVRFRFERGAGDQKVPHMGWNTMRLAQRIPLVTSLDDLSRFYFVHSYHVIAASEQDVMGVTTYGYEFTSAVARGNIFGVQFHPEKSHRFGLQLLRNFAAMGAGVKPSVKPVPA